MNRDLSAGGVALDSTPDAVHAFFGAHPAYRVCKDFGAGLVAVRDSQYIVIAYRDGKVSNLDVGPAIFSVGNVAAYCR